MIVGNAGILVTRVIYVQAGRATRRSPIVDAAMNDLIRPTLYEAHHEIWPVREAKREHVALMVQDIVGPVARPAIIWRSTRTLPPLAAGDLIAVMTAGAYGAVMSSTYNTRPLVPEVLVKGEQHAIVRPRVSVEQLIALDRVPAWLD